MRLPLDPRLALRLTGESVREAGILIGVFGPLDALIRSGTPDWAFVLKSGVVGFLLAALGIIVECSRREGHR